MPASSTHRLPNGSLVVFEEEGHRYTCDGMLVESSTERIGQYFSPFNADEVSFGCAKKAAKEEFGPREEAPDGWLAERAAKFRAEWKATAERGTRIHAAIERVLSGEEWAETPETLPYQEYANGLLLKIRETYPDAEIYTELLLADPKLGVAGTADLVIHIGRHWIITDWKTGNQRIKGHWGIGICSDLLDTSETKYGLQTLLYAHLLRASGYAEADEDIETHVIFLADDGDEAVPREMDISDEKNLQGHLNRMLFG